MTFIYDEAGIFLETLKETAVVNFNVDFSRFTGSMTIEFFLPRGSVEEVMAMMNCSAVPDRVEDGGTFTGQRLCLAGLEWGD